MLEAEWGAVYRTGTERCNLAFSVKTLTPSWRRVFVDEADGPVTVAPAAHNIA